MHTTIGADPELFIKLNNKPVTAYGLIEGTKQEPKKVENGAVQVDGMALEFNIDPADNNEQFVKNIIGVQDILMEMVPGFEKFDKPLAEFGKEYMDKQPEISKVLGCEPDYDAYTFSENVVPDPESTFRTAGGHVHVGGYYEGGYGSVDAFYEAARMSRAMDAELGIYSILWDKDVKRREMYGKPGNFRFKDYGMEYRTLSNSWIFNKELISIVYDFTLDAVERWKNNDDCFNPVYKNILERSDSKHNIFKRNEKAERVMEAINAT